MPGLRKPSQGHDITMHAPEKQAIEGAETRAQMRPTAVRDKKKPLEIVNAMTVDVEDYFQVQAFAHAVSRDSWETMPIRVEANSNGLLDLFAEAEISATFFVLGWVAERFPQLIRRMAAEGHEIAR